jgi:phage terminase small subunit
MSVVCHLARHVNRQNKQSLRGNVKGVNILAGLELSRLGGMPDKTGRLTPMERQFVKHYASTNDAAYSAAKAGYGAPATRGSELAHKPAIVAAARAEALETLAGRILPLAARRHLEMLNDKLCTGQTLNRAIELAYKYGFGDQADKPAKQPHEMTGEELAEAISTLKRAAADKARPVIEHETPEADAARRLLELEQGAGVFD